MTTNKNKSAHGTPPPKDPVVKAHEAAEKDMLGDPELSDPDPTDDLDEGELARKDNSDEQAFDQLEKRRKGDSRK